MSDLYKSDFEGLYLRANNFKGTGQFNDGKIAEYKSIVRFYASKAYRFNKHIFFRVGMEQEDVETIGHSYVYTFFINNKMTFNDAHHESSILQMYLRQRFEHMIIVMNRKIRGMAETSNYENFCKANHNSSLEMDVLDRISAHDAMTTEQLLVSECTKKELKSKILRYIDIVYAATFNRYKGVIEELKLSDTDYRKICLFYTAKTIKNLQGNKLKSNDIKKIRILIYNLLNKNYGNKRMSRINKILNHEIDIDA